MQRIAEALSSLLRIVTAVTCGNLEDAGPEISDALCCSFKTQPDPCPAAAICSSHFSSSAACCMVATNTFRTDDKTRPKAYCSCSSLACKRFIFKLIYSNNIRDETPLLHKVLWITFICIFAYLIIFV